VASADTYVTGAIKVAPIPEEYIVPTAIQAASTYTPGTSSQIIAAGTYCSGAQTIKGDINLIANNIKQGINIFGVTGTFVGSGSGESDPWSEAEDAIIEGTVENYTNDRVSVVRPFAFYSCPNLTSIDFS
jgi:hypothetical protein